jgi:hypothetical protein
MANRCMSKKDAMEVEASCGREVERSAAGRPQPKSRAQFARDLKNARSG